MTRPIERIAPVLKLVAEAWIKNPDLRLMQLLENAGLNYHSEDLISVVKALHNTYGTTKLLWGTRGKDGKSKLKYLELEELSNDHIRNIIKTQFHIDEYTIKILTDELNKRGVSLNKIMVPYEDVLEILDNSEIHGNAYHELEELSKRQ